MDGDAPAAPRGWYHDPFKRFAFRYWDGSRWTGYAANSEVAWDDFEPAHTAVAEADVAPPKPGVVTAIVGYVLGVLFAFAVDIAFSRANNDFNPIVYVITSQIALWSGIVGACVLVSRRRGTGSLARDFDWRFRKIDIGFGFAGALAGRIIGAIVAIPVAIPFGQSNQPQEDVFDRATSGAWSWVVLVVIVCIGAPVIEELFFRGLMQPRLVERFGTAAGLVITAVLFGAAHMINWQGAVTFVYATSIAGSGLALGLLRHVTGRLGPAIAAHFVFNAQAVLLTALLA